ncbi:molybdopterin synthase subunit MoaD [Halobiforma haloterrestris]|uniref:Molybdopterin synthase subunit MoaD n=1 Tax=Natronobacterium haloterrestre TaxID=148448 RepID=A0A1I1J686_NATHA|nr:MoaD/ThiS family protein [Halobiforma haloterrestris]SFC43905.1 molybdopterin synthase subunit MoaD [Halobiforma haloterrestris]
MPTIKVPAVLSGGGASSRVEVEGETLREAFDAHAAEHGESLRDSVIEDGEIKEFINVYVDGDEVSDLEVPVDEGSQIRVIPAASGGAR